MMDRRCKEAGNIFAAGNHAMPRQTPTSPKADGLTTRNAQSDVVARDSAIHHIFIFVDAQRHENKLHGKDPARPKGQRA